MQVILRQDVAHLGEVGDVVTVKAGYARNYLLPRNLAVTANERQKRRLEHERRLIELHIAKARTLAEQGRKKLEDFVGLTVAKKVGENEKLFGSVTAMEIEELLRDEGFDISRKQVLMTEPIKSAGVHPIEIKLHRDVVATIKIYVVAQEG